MYVVWRLSRSAQRAVRSEPGAGEQPELRVANANAPNNKQPRGLYDGDMADGKKGTKKEAIWQIDGVVFRRARCD
jgi:hypothetical protein